MRRLLWRPFLFVLGVLLLLWGPVAFAFSYYPPSPQGLVGLSRPIITQQLLLEPGDRIVAAEMWIDGQIVFPTWDAAGRVSYQPREPLAPGEHEVRLRIRVVPADPTKWYEPVESRFKLRVAEDAAAELRPAGAEELRALERVNEIRLAAGLNPLEYDLRLAAAALGHARYLAANPSQIELDGHAQRQGLPLYFGTTVGERVRYYAYDGGVNEVINFVARAEDAVDGWMETLYHRLPLIHPGMSALGYGLAAGSDRTINVMELGPYGPDPGLVRWPYPGQQDVPPAWDGGEAPDPFRLYPGVRGPVGYPITLTFGGEPAMLTLDEWSLHGPAGEVAVLRFDPQVDPLLSDSVALIPVSPLSPNTRYTVVLKGRVDLGQGAQPYEYRWSFTTGAERRPKVKSWVAVSDGKGNLRSVRVEGEGFQPGSAVYLGGLPVEALQIQSDRILTFQVPAGYQGGKADLLLVTPGGREAVWESFFSGTEGYRPASSAPAFTQVPLQVAGKSLPAPALRTAGGALLLPEEALTALGAQPERIDAIGRTYWRLGDRTGDYTLGRLVAGVQESDLRLALPVQQYQGRVYVDAAFVEQLAEVKSALIEGRLYVGRPVAGILDIEGHWAFDAVRTLLERGIVAGYGDGSFRPDATLTRAAFIKMIVGAVGLEPLPGQAPGITDSAGHWVTAQGYLGAAVAAGIVIPGEYPGGRLEPDRAIDREEMAVMITRALGLEAQAASRQVTLVGGEARIGDKRFADAASWRRPGYIATAVEAGIITGYAEPDGRFTFRPARPATRAEAATMLLRMMDRQR